MLASLSIRNFVLIEDAVLEFSPGLNVLTGETGAGKTLLTRALGLLMGERAEEGLVGRAASEALIQAVFEVTEADLVEVPEDTSALVGGLDAGELIVSRRLGAQGRNRCYINDTVVTLGAMGGVVGALLSLAGQHEYRRLLDPDYQLSVLDQWAGSDAVALAEEFRSAYGAARDAERRLKEATAGKDSRDRELDLLRFQVGELREAGLSLEEEEALLAEQRLLSRAEEVVRSAGAAAGDLRGEDEGPDAGGLLAQAGAHLAGLAGIDPELDGMAATLNEVQYQVTELARDLHAYVGRVPIDPARLEEVNARLRLYTDLGRKYGGSTASAVQQLADAEDRLERLELQADSIDHLEEVRAVSIEKALQLARALTAKRAAAAPLLEEAVAGQLADLGMEAAALVVELRSNDEWRGLREKGADAVEFMLRANEGQPAKSLAKTASGGELSRVLLAIKCALAGVGGNETLVFDEVDAGIGGRTAVAVGNKLRELAGRAQVIVVTHLPQVAALAAGHHVIEKTTLSGATVARLTKLDNEALVVGELCRMLGGRTDDAEAMAHARELRDRAAGGLLD